MDTATGPSCHGRWQEISLPSATQRPAEDEPFAAFRAGICGLPATDAKDRMPNEVDVDIRDMRIREIIRRDRYHG
jgi:hypothetical protein